MRRCEYLPLPARLVLIAVIAPFAFVVGASVDAVQEWLRNREEQADEQ